MTRRNDKRNNRRNRQRNNGNEEASKFASMMMGAIMGKAFEEVFGKKDDEESSGIHAEGITSQDITNINNGKARFTKCSIPTDGTAVEIPIPDNLQVFISEDGKPMIRKKIEGAEKVKTPDAAEGKPITYDDISKTLFLNKRIFFILGKDTDSGIAHDENYDDLDNCTSEAQAKRIAAFNKLQNIAKYLNGDWKPDFDGDHENWNITKDGDTYTPMYTKMVNKANTYFKSEDLAYEAIHLMGEESLNDLFSTDW